MTIRSDKLPPDPAWVALEQHYPGNPFLAEDPLYSLTEDVINAIKAHLPGFFTQQQEVFELDLARQTGGGFFLRRSLGKPTSVFYKPGLTIGEFLEYRRLPQQQAEEMVKRLSPALKPEWFKDEHTAHAIKTIRAMMVTLWEARGSAEQDIQAVQRQEQEESRLIERRGEAYAGWLICNQQFRQELAELQATWGMAITRRGGFPKPESLATVDDKPAPKKKRDACTQACFAFYRRWCLDCMLTWDLPAPLDARLHYTCGAGPALTNDEGVTLLLPWYLLRGGQFDLRQVIHRIRFEATPEHLREWVSKPSDQEGKSTGEISYQRLYWFYRCYELVLFRRYRKSCENNIEKLDIALGTVIDLDEDWVKRLRQQLARTLHGPIKSGQSDK